LRLYRERPQGGISSQWSVAVGPTADQWEAFINSLSCQPTAGSGRPGLCDEEEADLQCFLRHDLFDLVSQSLGELYTTNPELDSSHLRAKETLEVNSSLGGWARINKMRRCRRRRRKQSLNSGMAANSTGPSAATGEALSPTARLRDGNGASGPSASTGEALSPTVRLRDGNGASGTAGLSATCVLDNKDQMIRSGLVGMSKPSTVPSRRPAEGSNNSCLQTPALSGVQLATVPFCSSFECGSSTYTDQNVKASSAAAPFFLQQQQQQKQRLSHLQSPADSSPMSAGTPVNENTKSASSADTPLYAASTPMLVRDTSLGSGALGKLTF
ncbi:unnamed protein product, partial [Protopolystoma xenopodis]